MKALTVTQPWATLVALGIKNVETRSWATSYRGPLAIHAAKGWSRDDREFAEDLFARGILPIPDVLYSLPRGAVIATCRLAYVGPTFPAFYLISDLERELGDYAQGRFGWSLTHVEPLPEPIPVRGALGLWEWERAA